MWYQGFAAEYGGKWDVPASQMLEKLRIQNIRYSEVSPLGRGILTSWESQQDAESYGETRSNTVDCRIRGISISTVKRQNVRRQNNVTKHKEQFL